MEIKDIKVSIVVAIYKSERFLDKLILSITDQTHKNLEIILVDDGSPDNSGEVCDRYAGKDERIKVIHKQNGGTCDARNKGIDSATGDYLMIVDGDDWLSLDYVEYLLNLAVSNDADMALSDKIFTTRDQVQVEEDKIEIWSAEQAVVSIIYPRMAIGPWNKIYKMDMIQKNNLRFDIPWSGEGLYFAAMAAAYSNKVAKGHRKIYNYRLNNNESGLTKYNVDIARNALYNIKNIGNVIPLKTSRVKAAVHWHTWKNYNFLLRLIMATSSVTENFKEFIVCLFMIRLMIPKLILKAEFSMKTKLQYAWRALFPIYYANKLTKEQQEQLKKDLMK